MPKTVKVSIALHSQQPELDGNQDRWELKYMNYNRRHVQMTIDDDGNGFVHARDLLFPKNGEVEAPTATWFSIGVAVAPGGKGGSIINCGPITEGDQVKLIQVLMHTAPVLTITAGVYAARLDEMRADGRFFDSMEPDYEHGLNLPS